MPIANLENPMIAGFDAIIDGSSLPVEAKTHIVSITVDDSADLPSMFEFEIGASDTQKDQTSWVDNESLFAVGKAVEIKMGYAEDLESLIKGEITALEPEFACDRPPRLTVRGYDRRHRLQRGRKTRTFVLQKDSDIASQIAGEAGLAAEVSDSQITYDYVFQANQSDLEFLQERSRRVHFEVVVADKKLIFRPVPNDQSEALTFTLSDHILAFYPRLTSAGQVGEVNVRGWSPKDKKEVIGKAKTGDEKSPMGGTASGPEIAEDAFGSAVSLMSANPVMTQAEADEMAKAQFNKRVLGFITGDGVCLGRTDLRAGKVIKIDGVGKRFSGQYYVTSAIHRYDSQGYLTHFTVRRSAS